MKKLFAFLSIALCICLLAGCAGTPVIYHMDCDCSTNSNTNSSDQTSTVAPAEGELKTG